MISVLRLSLAFALLGSSALAAQTAPTPAPHGHLTVWISSRQDPGWSSLFHKLHRDFPDMNTNWKLFAPVDFLHAIGKAQTNSTLPDVIFIDSADQANPLWQSLLARTMAGRSRFADSGWWFLVKNSPDAEQAKTFLLWLEAPAVQQPYSPRTELLSAEQKEAVSHAAIQIVQARLRSSAPPATLLDPALASASWNFSLSHYAKSPVVPQTSPSTLEIGGNEHLAFISVATSLDTGQIFGIVNSFLLFRRDASAWKLIFFDGNDSVDGVARLFDKFDGLNLANLPAQGTTDIVLRAPADEESLTRFPKPQLVFTTTGAPARLIGIESQYADQYGRVWSPGKLDWVRDTGDKTIRTLAPFGAGFQPHRWRVWAVDQTGSITLSEWRTINFTN